jgi:glucokinase
MKPEQILGVGLAVPGITDPEQGMVAYSPAFQWHEIAVQTRLSQKLDLPVFIENDVNASALAEKFWGVAKTFQDFVFISIGTGIGAGLILNGELHRGYQYAAGEIGYTIVDINWLKNQEIPGRLSFGCLESLAAAAGIVERARELGFAKMKQEDISAEAVFEAARQGEPLAVRVIEEMTDYLAAGIINIALIVSPQAVILGGGVAGAGDILLDMLRRKIYAASPIKPELLLSSMPADAGLTGAASLAVRKAKQKLIEN